MAAAVLPGPLRAQSSRTELQEVLPRVVPAAERFSDKGGDPPVFRAFATDPATGREALVGYAFLSSDLPPEEIGYDGPIRMLVGIDLAGAVTGMAILDYYESHRRTRGDFLRVRGFQEQFAGKAVADPFRVRMDVDGISGATISVGAVARTVRNSARRVASAYLAARVPTAEPLLPGTVTAEQLEGLTWPDIMDGGLVQRMIIVDRDRPAVDVSMVYLRDASIGVALMGTRGWEEAIEKAGERGQRDHLFMVGVDGPLALLFRPTALFLAQDGDTLRLASTDVVQLGAPRTGKVSGQFHSIVLAMVDRDAVDVRRPLATIFDLRPGMDWASAQFPGTAPPAPRVASAPAAPEAEGGTGEAGAGHAPAAPDEAGGDARPGSGGDAGDGGAEPAAAAAGGAADGVDVPAEGAADPPQVAPAAPPEALTFAFEGEESESLLARTLADTSWPRVLGLALVLALASAAFAAKVPALRWAALGATLLFLGVVDRGFLSVSHVTSGIRVGPAVYLSDFSLLLLATFTLVTTLLWGRVFCGFLCPFGALQDFLEKVVPRRFRRELPRRFHAPALKVKYVLLAIVLAPALLGSTLSFYQYFEPFGTVFFLSTSLGLWTIAGGILVASAVVPRFYCRYMCPLGAALAVASTVSPFRIRRVEQCGYCKVCEVRCPTGAIRGPDIDFKECVRCNVCEVKLKEKAGVCRHDMETVRSRLVQIRIASR